MTLAARPNQLWDEDPIGGPISRALTALEKLPSTPVRQRLITTLELARDELARVRAGGPDARDPYLTLWQLGRPGFLRELGDEAPAPPSGVVVLVPVALTWLGLGLAEFSYGRRLAAVPVHERPSFFADWFQRPWWQGPVLLCALVFISLVLIMYVYLRVESRQRSVDSLDTKLLWLEAELIKPIAELRRVIAVGDADDRVLHAAARLADSADRFGRSFDRVAEVGPVVDTLVDAAQALRAAVPEVGQHAAAIAALDQRLQRTAREVAEQTVPLIELVGTAASAVETARAAALQAEVVVGEAARQMDQAREAFARAEAISSTIGRAADPFTSAAARTDSAAARLTEAAEALNRNTLGLENAIARVNWVKIALDGLPYTDGHGHGDGQ